MSQTGYKHLEELLRRKEHLILKQAQEIIELKQKLLLTQNLLNEAKHRRKKTYVRVMLHCQALFLLLC